MDYRQHAAIVIRQGLLEARPCRDIQVVDGFIEQQEGAALGHQQGQFKPGTFPITHFTARTQRIVTAEKEEMQKMARFCLVESPGAVDGFQRTFSQIQMLLFLGHIA